jgi:hypothetical protein
VGPPEVALWTLLTEKERVVREEGAALPGRSRSRAVRSSQSLRSEHLLSTGLLGSRRAGLQ